VLPEAASPPVPLPRFCRGQRQDGEPCGNWPIRGGTVCREHGGADPKVRARANEVLEQVKVIRRMQSELHWRDHR
jgi:hypothetical protein